MAACGSCHNLIASLRGALEELGLRTKVAEEQLSHERNEHAVLKCSYIALSKEMRELQETVWTGDGDETLETLQSQVLELQKILWENDGAESQGARQIKSLATASCKAVALQTLVSGIEMDMRLLSVDLHSADYAAENLKRKHAALQAQLLCLIQTPVDVKTNLSVVVTAMATVSNEMVEELAKLKDTFVLAESERRNTIEGMLELEQLRGTLEAAQSELKEEKIKHAEHMMEHQKKEEEFSWKDSECRKHVVAVEAIVGAQEVQRFLEKLDRNDK